ncbi:MAG: glycosyltransferase family protein [Paracoccaceae bacterium]
MRVMIVVTHLLGTGHLSRALTLARAFHAAGHPVTLVSGGMPVPHLDTDGLDLVQLPPLRSDGVSFTRLLTEDGLADETYLSTRRDALVQTLQNCAPDALICELFPFGRRVLAPEFMALLDATATLPKRPVTLCSIRDILAPPSSEAKAQKTETIIHNHFDGVLVHSDPAMTPLEVSWPVTDRLQPLLRYTGYVAPPAAGPHPGGLGDGEVLVSAGGGAVGDHLYDTALNAAALDPSRTWRLLVGGSNRADRIERFSSTAPANAIVEPARPDFRQMLYHASAISQCGYNTALDLLQAGTPAVLVPFDDGGEVEQTLRAESLAHLPGLSLLRSGDLKAQALLNALADSDAAGRRDTGDLQFDGANETVRLTMEMVEAMG